MELHSTVKIDTLSNSWDEEGTEVTLKVYELCFTSKSNDNKTYSNFAILIKSELDDDITNTDIDLFLTTVKVVKAEFLRRGEMTLDLTQVLKDKHMNFVLQSIHYNLLPIIYLFLFVCN